MIKLQFKDKTSADCKILGRAEVDGKTYAVFFEPEKKNIYIYRCKPKKHKCKLTPITDEEEFRKVCAYISQLPTA